MPTRILSLCCTLTVALATVAPLGYAEEVKVDPALEPFKSGSGISGNLNSIGSDTLNNLMTLWAEGFHKFYPSVNIQVEGKGSATGPPALIQGTAQLGPMSRLMKKEEEEEFEKTFGYKPTRISVALDCLAVYVHKDNPVARLSLAQADGIFSKTRKLGGPNIATWGQLGVRGELAALPISMYGRNSASGTYAYFKEHALGKGDFKNEVKEQPGSAAVVQGVAKDRAAIGYSGIGYRTSEVRALALAKGSGTELIEPTFENALKGKYPLGRALFIYINKKPSEPLPPLVKEFLRYVLSKDGQEVVIKDGYGPLPKSVIEKQLLLIE
ncbi:MAG: PstS family phosphate ABC transporter substrate-binding protein [Pirellulaceae bacterium]